MKRCRDVRVGKGPLVQTGVVGVLCYVMSLYVLCVMLLTKASRGRLPLDSESGPKQLSGLEPA